MPTLTASSTAAVLQRLSVVLKTQLRIAILAALQDDVASPSQLAAMLGESLSKVCRDIKVLVGIDAIELVKADERGGTVEHFYRATERRYFSDAEWRELPRAVKEGISTFALQAMASDVVTSNNAGTFDELDDRHLSRSSMVLDQQGWQDTNAVLVNALDELARIQDEASRRLADSGEPRIRTKVHMLHFKSPAPDD